MRNIFTLLFILGITTLSYSQEVRFGFTVSPTFNFANTEAADNPQYTDDTDSKTGIAYGVLLDYDFNGEDRYFLHTGLTLHHTGYETEVLTSGVAGFVTTTNDVNVNYLEIPLALKLKTNDIGYLRYYGQFGLHSGINIGEKVKESTMANKDYDEFKTFNAGLNMGGGVEYTISEETSAVGGLYFNNGFTKVADTNAGTIKQNQLGIRLGVYF